MDEDDTSFTMSKFIAQGFSGFSDAYLALLDGLHERGFERGASANIAMDLVNSYFQFTNNNKLAESSVFMAIEEDLQ